MAEITSQIDDVLITPLERLLAEVGSGVAAAQRAMNLSSIASQAAIAGDPVLRQLGLQATWYHMPEVEVELKLFFTLRKEDRTVGDRFVSRRYSLLAAPLNATYQNSVPGDVSGSSSIRARIVSLPPPGTPAG